MYGPAGRPDMAPWLFTEAIMNDQPIKVFNYGKHRRDFTYIDDIVEGVLRVVDRPAQANLNWDSNQPDPASSTAPWQRFNIGNQRPVELLTYISALEQALGKKALIDLLPLQPGDVLDTFADVSDLVAQFDYQPTTCVEVGIDRFVRWYQNYFAP